MVGAIRLERCADNARYTRAASLRAARTLLERSAGVEVWKNSHCIAHLSPEAQLWHQLRQEWMASC